MQEPVEIQVISNKKNFRAALPPVLFNNETFWKFVNEENIQDPVQFALDTLYCHIKVDYRGHFVSSPDIEQLFFTLKGLFRTPEELKSLLTWCLLEKDPILRKDFQDYLVRLISDNNTTKILQAQISNKNNDNTQIKFDLPGYLDNQFKLPEPCCSALMIKILSGIMAACGALIVALSLLNPLVMLKAVTVGSVALLAGIGLFSFADKIATSSVVTMNQPGMTNS